MGILKSLLKGLMSEAGKAVADKISEQLEEAGSSSYTENTMRSTSSNKAVKNTKDGYLKHNMAYFRGVLQEEFPECNIEENVSAESLGWNVANEYKTYGVFIRAVRMSLRYIRTIVWLR